MLHAMNRMLLGNSITRKYQYRLIRKIKKIIGYSDAYDDLFRIARRVQPSGILDIGSYIGKTINKFLDELNIHVYGFEPTPDSYKVLKERFGHKKQVSLFNCALSNVDGKQKFFSNKNPQTNSLLDNDIGNESFFDEYSHHVESETVDVMTLDTWASRYLPVGKIIIKADIQGAEGLLLDGGAHTFSDQVIAFYSEAQIYPMYKNQTSFFELHSRLTKEFCFFLHNIYPCFHDKYGRAVQLDALWVKEKFIDCLASPS
jgi:FkbM family methyltransferase